MEAIPIQAFPRKRESSFINNNWVPAFAGTPVSQTWLAGSRLGGLLFLKV